MPAELRPGDADQQARRCTVGPCPIDCVFDEWKDWGACDQACGEGTQARKRNRKVLPKFGGKDCEGLFAEDPLFEPSSLFDDSPSLFDDQPPLFEEGSLFGEDSTSLEPPSLFESEEPLFGPGVGGSGRDRGEEETVESGGGSRDRGPGGRWRPATGGR